MKRTQWIIICWLCGYNFVSDALLNSVIAEELPNTVSPAKKQSADGAKDNNKIQSTETFDCRLYTEASDADAVRRIDELHENADVFIYCHNADQLFCRIDNKFVKNPVTSSWFSQEQLTKVLHSRGKRKKRKLLLVQMADHNILHHASPITPKQVKISKECLEKLGDFLIELDFKRTLVVLPQLGTKPSQWKDIVRPYTNGYYVLLDRISKKNESL